MNARRLIQRLAPLAAAAAALTAAGCKSTTYTDYGAFVVQPRPVVTATEYRLAPPDMVRVTSRRVREIDRHEEAVRPDGKITLPLLGSVFVAGKTCEEVSAELLDLSKAYYGDPDVSVHVVGFHSKKIYVFGEVASPGPYPYNGANTVLGTLAYAQPTRLADPRHIHVLRPNADGRLVRRMTINLNHMVREGDTALDAVLEEQDIVYVPANGLASVGLALQQLLLPIQPAAATVRGTAAVESTTVGTTYGRPSQ